jgi:predicted DNA-binding transcriptional regulator YafY
MLAGTAEGLTLDEMASRLEVGRRTVERMRDAVREVFPQMEDIDDPPTRRFRIPSGLDGLFQAPTAEELAALRTASEALSSSGAQNRAAALATLEAKLMASMRPGVRRRLAPDVEALLQAETIAVQAGPRPFEEDEVLARVREAIKSMRALRLRYDGGSTPGRMREVVPFGLLFGRSLCVSIARRAVYVVRCAMCIEV